MSLYLQNLLPVSQLATFVTTRHTSLDDTLTALNLTHFSVIQMEQTHRNLSAFVTNSTPSPVPAVDAVMTTEPNVVLIIRTADCVPILIYHPSGLIAAIHAGRKGTEQDILKLTLQKMVAHTKSTDHYSLYFGPAICKNCYETDLIKLNTEQAWTVLTPRTSMIYYSNQCTSCQNDRFFSWRKEGTDRRLYSGIAIKLQKGS